MNDHTTGKRLSEVEDALARGDAEPGSAVHGALLAAHSRLIVERSDRRSGYAMVIAAASLVVSIVALVLKTA